MTLPRKAPEWLNRTHREVALNDAAARLADCVPADAGVQSHLADLAERHFGVGARVEGLQRLSGGASQELWAFTVEAGGVAHRLVMRRNPGGIARAISAGMEAEARVMRLAHVAGVPVPGVVVVLETQDGLGTGFVMAHVAGETIAPRILREETFAAARPKLARQLGAAAARIHTIDTLNLRPVSAPQALEDAEALYRSQGVARPVMEWALRWLHKHVPRADTPMVAVHGDLRNGNIVVGPEGLRAVLDWEAVHAGDPMEDLAWLCVTSWRFGVVDLPVGGFGTRAELFAGYEEAGGAVDSSRVHFWEVLGTLRWGLTCGIMAAEFRDGELSVEKAAIGRRTSETELDLLAILAPRGGYIHA